MCRADTSGGAPRADKCPAAAAASLPPRRPPPRRRGRRRVGEGAFARRSSPGCRVAELLGCRGGALHHHHGAWIGLLETQRGGALLDRAERGEAVDLQPHRLVGVLEILFLLLEPRRLLAEEDHGVGWPGSDDTE